MRLSLLGSATGLAIALAATSQPATASQPRADELTRNDVLTLADVKAVYPDARQPIRIVKRSPLFAPRECQDQGTVVRGTSRIFTSVSPNYRRRSVMLVDQTVVRLKTAIEARAVVALYRSFGRRGPNGLSGGRELRGHQAAAAIRRQARSPGRGQAELSLLTPWLGACADTAGRRTTTCS